MKHGGTLLMALAKIDRPDDDDAAPTAPLPAEPLPPIRPGAFAAWAVRRPGPGTAEPVREPVRAARLGRRPLREGPPVI
jgi:hypothetical protein